MFKEKNENTESIAQFGEGESVTNHSEWRCLPEMIPQQMPFFKSESLLFDLPIGCVQNTVCNIYWEKIVLIWLLNNWYLYRQFDRKKELWQEKTTTYQHCIRARGRNAATNTVAKYMFSLERH